MKMKLRFIALLTLCCMLLTCAVGCGGESSGDGGEQAPEFVDYVAQTKLDMNSDTAKQEVDGIKSFIDGDTTHFYVPTSIRDTGVMKARYLGVNTPESTGQIEPYGKKASKFTKEKLSTAVSIIVESDDDKWNLDSTGDRHTVWVWYKPADGADYRCLNLELVQEGLSVSAGTVDVRYYSATSAALQQAKVFKLNAQSGEKDPDYYYGDAQEIDLKNLRTNVEMYENVKVAFEGVVARINNNVAYVEEYDAETGIYYGMPVFYGYVGGRLLEILSVGNRVRVVGTYAIQDATNNWQISGLTYLVMRPNDPANTQLISEGHSAAYVETDPALFAHGMVELEVPSSTDSEETELKSFRYASLVEGASISMKNLTVVGAYTTDNGGKNDGAMTLTCRAEDGTYIDVRTIVLFDESGNLLTEADYLDKTIDVVGIVDCFSGSYQIKVLSDKDITVH